MEPTQAALRKHLRLVLKLGKFQVIERHMDTFKVALGGSTTLTATDPVLTRTNVQAGDWITLYTEVPLADSIPTSKQ